MGVIQRVAKPTTQRGKRALEKRASKLIENDKKALFINGQSTSPAGREFLKCIYAFKKMNSIFLGRKNPILPFEDGEKLERMSKKYDASLFAVTTHSKKRPNNVVLGRMYNNTILDMIELGVSDWLSLSQFRNSKVSCGTKPCLLFHGVGFTQFPEHVRLKSLLIDFFRGPAVTNVSLTGFELALQFTSFEEKIYMRGYRILLKKSGTDVPRVELVEIGPSLTLSLRRTKLASDDNLKAACKKPKELKVKKKKNININPLGTKFGRIHMEKQDLRKLQVRKTPAIKKAKQLQIARRKAERGLANTVNAINSGE
uniref:Ribosome production factor 2 homolog n=1 Tax=Hirondellea gigas TaxID=1518452 RepID=A0A2P2HYI7_9CRUS